MEDGVYHNATGDRALQQQKEESIEEIGKIHSPATLAMEHLKSVDHVERQIEITTEKRTFNKATSPSQPTTEHIVIDYKSEEVESDPTQKELNSEEGILTEKDSYKNSTDESQSVSENDGCQNSENSNSGDVHANPDQTVPSQTVVQKPEEKGEIVENLQNQNVISKEEAVVESMKKEIDDNVLHQNVIPNEETIIESMGSENVHNLNNGTIPEPLLEDRVADSGSGNVCNESVGRTSTSQNVESVVAFEEPENKSTPETESLTVSDVSNVGVPGSENESTPKTESLTVSDVSNVAAPGSEHVESVVAFEEPENESTPETEFVSVSDVSNVGAPGSEHVESVVAFEEQENESMPKAESLTVSDAPESETTNDSEVSGMEDKPISPNDLAEESVDNEDKKEEDECMDILGNGLLTKKVLQPGDGRKTRPVYGDIVTIESTGKLEDGTEVEIGTFTFTVGDGDVVQCWDMVLPLMEMNEKCEVFTGFKYAYGTSGRAPNIPNKADITYILKLIKKEDPPELDSMCLEDRMKMGEQKRERGNDLFLRLDFAGAINSYNKAIKILDPENCNEEAEQLQILLESRLKCYNNMAACQLKIEAYDAAIKSCECVLKAQPENVKALFRMGKAYAANQDVKLSIFYLKKALQIEPETKIIHQELSKLTKKMKKENDTEKDMYRKMLGTTALPEAKPKQTWLKWSVFTTAVVAAVVSVGLAAYRYTQH